MRGYTPTMVRRLSLLLVFLAALDAAAAMREFTVRVGGVERSYLLYVPEGKRAAKWPLLVLMHGGGGGARQAARSYGMNDVADRHRFLVAYPNGSGRRADILLTWNAGNCCGYAKDRSVDDVKFIRAMVEQIDRDFGIDRSRVYATGMSNGGMMAHRLGCEAADLFAAIAPVAGALNLACKPTDAVAVMIFHGTADEHVPYDGGTGKKSLEPRLDQPVSHAVDVWRNANACKRALRIQPRGNLSRQTWSECRDGTEVSLVTIRGGGHAWPGGVAPPRAWADVPTTEVSASEEMWKFFEAHPKR